MRLRSQLVLFFSLVLGVIAAALVGLTQHQTRTNLLGDIRSHMTSGGRFEARQAEVLKLLALLSFRVEERTADDHNKFVGGSLDLLTEKEDFKTVIERLSRAKPNGPEIWTNENFNEDTSGTPLDRAYYRCFMALRDLAYDAGHDLMEDSGGVLDFLGMTDRRGHVVFVLTTEADGKPPAPGKPIEPPQVVPGLQKLVDDSLKSNGEASDGYIVHSDGQLYLMHCRPFLGGRGGRMLLGYRMDARSLKLTSAGSEQEVGVVVGKKATVPTSPQLETALAGLKPPAQGDIEESPLAGHRYLVSSIPLRAQLADPGSEVVGYGYNLRSLASVEIYLHHMTEGIATVGILSLLAGVIGIRILSGRVTTPIERLARQMDLVGDGDLTQKMEGQGSYEVQLAGQAFNRMVEDLRQKEMLAKMVPKQAREAIAKADVVGGRVAGRRLKTTILFSDIRGFTSLSEQLSPAEVMGLLDIYLSRMTTVIESCGGDVNEYIGDAILADFEDRDGISGAVRAVKAAFEMTRALADLKAQDLHPHLKELRQGIGLNTGEVVKGEIGASDRSKFAMVGDAVNLAARVQDRSRDGRHTCILVTEGTYHEASGEFEFALFGDEEFKGKSGKIRVWEVTAPVARSSGALRPVDGKPPIAGV